LGPPRGTNFSRRNATQPLPPLPAFTRIFASSMNTYKTFAADVTQSTLIDESASFLRRGGTLRQKRNHGSSRMNTDRN
jgi:hypothetical protein